MRAMLGEKIAKCLAMQRPRAHFRLVSQGRLLEAVTFQMYLGEQQKYRQGQSHEGFVLHLKHNRKYSRVFA